MNTEHQRIAITPIFRIHDPAETAAFYQHIGFDVDPFDAGYTLVSYHANELLHLVTSDVPTIGTAYLNVPDADAWHARCVEAGLSPTVVENRSWGMREFSITDPSGNVLRIGTNL